MVQELPSIESIFDFLYLDNTKIKSFYAQLTGVGSLTSIKENYSSNTADAKETAVSIPTIANAKLTYNSSHQRADEKLYDAIPTMPREMIDKLDELGFIDRSLSEQSAGKLVLLKGKLNITDVSTLKDLIEPALKLEALENTNALPNKKKQSSISNEYKILVEIVKAIPYALEATLFVGDDTVWMTLNRDEMVGNPHDINLKHGNLLFGEYYVLGVLDAVPNDDEVIESSDEWHTALSAMVTGLKTMMGRKSNSYGITPIAIFRVIYPTI